MANEWMSRWSSSGATSGKNHVHSVPEPDRWVLGWLVGIAWGFLQSPPALTLRNG